MMNLPFLPAKVLLPKNCDMTRWSVVACDQYTSEPEYWKEVENFVGNAPSTLKITLPEVYLNETDVKNRIDNIHNEMEKLVSENFFDKTDSVIYVERTQADGKIRKGIVGAVDLEAYSYEKGSQTLIRATEGTVLERIPPRMKVRNGALLEAPHIMLLIDDPDFTAVEAITPDDDNKLYDFELMRSGGSIKGWKLNSAQQDSLLGALENLGEKTVFEKKYGITDKNVLLFAVGDGNHSLATAKACYEELKKSLSPEEAANHPARYALVEIVNLHSSALEFEPIHRVVFDVDEKNFFSELEKFYKITYSDTNGQTIKFITADKSGVFTITNPSANLAVGSLQNFIDDYIKRFGGKVDYIHGDDVVEKLAKQGNIGLLLPKPEKSQLFPTVILDGALPRKTFSMGHSYDKRFYLEARKITL